MLDELIELDENQYSKTIIKPLFEKIYNCRVEFTGGGIEKGRDLIVYKKDELGIEDYIGIQVKKLKATPNSAKNSFQQLLTQIEQLKNEGVVEQCTGQKLKFRKLVFITPYTIYDRAYDSHLGAFQKIIDLGVTILDGPKIVNLIKVNMPELERQITGKDVYIENKILPKLVNTHLMNALNFDGFKNISDLFCETSFIAGNKESLSPITKVLPNSSRTLIAEYHEMDYFIQANIMSNTHLGCDFVDSAVLDKMQTSYELNQRLEDEKRPIEFENDKIRFLVKSRITNSKYRDLYPNFDDRADFENFLSVGYESCKIDGDKREFYREVLELDTEYSNYTSNIKREAEIRLEQSSHQKSFELGAHIEKVSIEYNKVVDEFLLAGKSIKDNLKSYLHLLLKLESTFPFILDHKELFKMGDLKGFDKDKAVPISLVKIFDSKLNTIVLGSAGSGKTTNLQMYTRSLCQNRENELVIYMTLDHLATLSTKVEEEDVLTGLFQYIQTLDPHIYSKSELDLLLKNSNSVLILDSVDEAIVNFDWILDALKAFSTKYTKCQIITSSRYTVRETKSLGFVNVSLLPFNDEQKRNFFQKWFSEEPDKASAIMEHLKENSALDQIVTNPLSATIMSILQSSGVPLPKSEASLYRKRFDLLSGVFDRFKGVNRMDCQPDLLLNAAKVLAFSMHVKRVRELSKVQIIDILTEKLIDETDIHSIVRELISPAEILLSTPNGRYGFGHLRFQEYLVSEQLVHERSLNIYKYITNPWWHDVFILYSQHAHCIEWVINHAASNDYTNKINSLLKIMISQRAGAEKSKLTSRLEIAVRDEAGY